MAGVTVEAQLRVQQENEQYIHTSRVTCAVRFGQKEVSFPLPDSLRRDGQVDNFSTALKESMSLFHLWTHWKRFARRALLWSCQLVPCRHFRLFLPRWPSNVCAIRSYVNQQYSALSLVGSSGVQTKVYCRSRPHQLLLVCSISDLNAVWDFTHIEIMIVNIVKPSTGTDNCFMAPCHYSKNRLETFSHHRRSSASISPTPSILLFHTNPLHVLLRGLFSSSLAAPSPNHPNLASLI